MPSKVNQHIAALARENSDLKKRLVEVEFDLQKAFKELHRVKHEVEHEQRKNTHLDIIMGRKNDHIADLEKRITAIAGEMHGSDVEASNLQAKAQSYKDQLMKAQEHSIFVSHDNVRLKAILTAIVGVYA